MYDTAIVNIHLCEYIVNKMHAFTQNAIDIGNHTVINGLSTILTPSAGYKVGILNSDGDEKSKRGDSNESKHGNSGGESDHRGSGDKGEWVNEGSEGEWHESSKLKKSSHEVEHGSLSV